VGRQTARAYKVISWFQQYVFHIQHLCRYDTGSNLPAQIDLMAKDGEEYHFHLMAKGGGSANKTFLYQETKAGLHNLTRKLESSWFQTLNP
jgi:tartrate dehydratase alpha subunit/fumarate hydratase class I-like protein